MSDYKYYTKNHLFGSQGVLGTTNSAGDWIYTLNSHPVDTGVGAYIEVNHRVNEQFYYPITYNLDTFVRAQIENVQGLTAAQNDPLINVYSSPTKTLKIDFRPESAGGYGILDPASNNYITKHQNQKLVELTIPRSKISLIYPDANTTGRKAYDYCGTIDLISSSESEDKFAVYILTRFDRTAYMSDSCPFVYIYTYNKIDLTLNLTAWGLGIDFNKFNSQLVSKPVVKFNSSIITEENNHWNFALTNCIPNSDIYFRTYPSSIVGDMKYDSNEDKIFVTSTILEIETYPTIKHNVKSYTFSLENSTGYLEPSSIVYQVGLPISNPNSVQINVDGAYVVNCVNKDRYINLIITDTDSLVTKVIGIDVGESIIHVGLNLDKYNVISGGYVHYLSILTSKRYLCYKSTKSFETIFSETTITDYIYVCNLSEYVSTFNYTSLGNTINCSFPIFTKDTTTPNKFTTLLSSPNGIGDLEENSKNIIATDVKLIKAEQYIECLRQLSQMRILRDGVNVTFGPNFLMSYASNKTDYIYYTKLSTNQITSTSYSNLAVNTLDTKVIKKVEVIPFTIGASATVVLCADSLTINENKAIKIGFSIPSSGVPLDSGITKNTPNGKFVPIHYEIMDSRIQLDENYAGSATNIDDGYWVPIKNTSYVRLTKNGVSLLAAGYPPRFFAANYLSNGNFNLDIHVYLNSNETVLGGNWNSAGFSITDAKLSVQIFDNNITISEKTFTVSITPPTPNAGISLNVTGKTKTKSLNYTLINVDSYNFVKNIVLKHPNSYATPVENLISVNGSKIMTPPGSQYQLTFESVYGTLDNYRSTGITTTPIIYQTLGHKYSLQKDNSVYPRTYFKSQSGSYAEITNEINSNVLPIFIVPAGEGGYIKFTYSVGHYFDGYDWKTNSSTELPLINKVFLGAVQKDNYFNTLLSEIKATELNYRERDKGFYHVDHGILGGKQRTGVIYKTYPNIISEAGFILYDRMSYKQENDISNDIIATGDVELLISEGGDYLIFFGVIDEFEQYSVFCVTNPIEDYNIPVG